MKRVEFGPEPDFNKSLALFFEKFNKESRDNCPIRLTFQLFFDILFHQHLDLAET